MKENTIRLYQNQSNLAKIAPEGRENFWGRKYFRFLKSKKKSLVTASENLNSGGTTNPHCVRGLSITEIVKKSELTILL